MLYLLLLMFFPLNGRPHRTNAPQRPRGAQIQPQTPRNSHEKCVRNEIWSDRNYLYVCVSDGLIKRTTLSLFGTTK